ncbi:hypothetical protein CROQUDRAFT_383682 [Cronartium quercuum f. sp. fusiforme G11]|uniref:Ubiquitin-like protease family profile domain-containing protein n=1 Tax=Cronartium quercuum f. sp. fusiforme G11 TaxID=708437 RepID=A0A9P6T5N9_9BASI|nr:hypothetical protein CROQUDRAFT_383682 [Cronartium quercuum f. sp. fusiforme G11]
MHPPATFFETGKQNRKPKRLQFDEILKKSKISLESAKPPEPNLPTYELLRQRELLLDKKHAAPIVKTRRWRVCLDEDKMRHVQRTLFDPNAKSDLPGALCEASDFQTLRPGTWLNDNVVNFYGVMINMRCSKYEEIQIESCPTLLSPGDPGFLRSYCFSSFFMTKYDKDGFNGVKRWSKKVDLFQKDVIIFPVNINNTHWTCAAINLRQKRFEFYDSMGNENRHVLDNLKDYIQNEHLAKRKVELDTLDWDYCYTKPPQQNNGYDCGVFVCQFMDCLSRDWGGGDTVFDFSQQNLPYIRNKVVYEISTRKFLEEEWS